MGRKKLNGLCDKSKFGLCGPSGAVANADAASAPKAVDVEAGDSGGADGEKKDGVEDKSGNNDGSPPPDDRKVTEEVEPFKKMEGGCFGCCCSHPQQWKAYGVLWNVPCSKGPSGCMQGPCCDTTSGNGDGQMGRTQEKLMWSLTGGLLFLFFLSMLVTYAWDVGKYKIVDRQTRTTEVEIIPEYTAKAVQFMYAWDGLATNTKLAIYTKWLTEWCGGKFKQSLSAGEKKTAIYDAFVGKYQIDMSEYDPVDWEAYGSVNEWFIRTLAVGVRPLAGARFAPAATGATFPASANWSAVPAVARTASAHAHNVVSPADCRMLIFPTLSNARVWIKGSSFSYNELLGNRQPYSTSFEGGAMVIARLAPQDYHRFNNPLTGTIRALYDIDGTYWSVNADAATSANYAFYNLRRVIIVEYAARDGTTKTMAYIAIGATCVGSVVFTGPTGTGLTVGEHVEAGTEFGFMQFGGSTVILLFEAGEFAGDQDLLSNSMRPVETRILVKERIGMLRRMLD